MPSPKPKQKARRRRPAAAGSSRARRAAAFAHACDIAARAPPPCPPPPPVNHVGQGWHAAGAIFLGPLNSAGSGALWHPPPGVPDLGGYGGGFQVAPPGYLPFDFGPMGSPLPPHDLSFASTADSGDVWEERSFGTNHAADAGVVGGHVMSTIQQSAERAFFQSPEYFPSRSMVLNPLVSQHPPPGAAQPELLLPPPPPSPAKSAENNVHQPPSTAVGAARKKKRKKPTRRERLAQNRLLKAESCGPTGAGPASPAVAGGAKATGKWFEEDDTTTWRPRPLPTLDDGETTPPPLFDEARFTAGSPNHQQRGQGLIARAVPASPRRAGGGAGASRWWLEEDRHADAAPTPSSAPTGSGPASARNNAGSGLTFEAHGVQRANSGTAATGDGTSAFNRATALSRDVGGEPSEWRPLGRETEREDYRIELQGFLDSSLRSSRRGSAGVGQGLRNICDSAGGGDDRGGAVELPLPPLTPASMPGIGEAPRGWPNQHSLREAAQLATPRNSWRLPGGEPWHQQTVTPGQRVGGGSWLPVAGAVAQPATAVPGLQGPAIADRRFSAESWRQEGAEARAIGRASEETLAAPTERASVVGKKLATNGKALATAGGATPMSADSAPLPGTQREAQLWGRLQTSAPPPAALPPQGKRLPTPSATPPSMPARNGAPSADPAVANISTQPVPTPDDPAERTQKHSIPVRGGGGGGVAQHNLSSSTSGANPGEALRVTTAGRASGRVPGELDAKRKRAALRNWRSAAYDHALVLCNAAQLPRKACAEAAKMPGARWVDRHELVEPYSLPLEVKPVLAKCLAAQMPSCASCDENDTGFGELRCCFVILGAVQAALVFC